MTEDRLSRIVNATERLRRYYPKGGCSGLDLDIILNEARALDKEARAAAVTLEDAWGSAVETSR